MNRRKKSEKYLIRLFDIIAGASALIILLPIFAIVAAAVRIDDRGSVFFVQDRVGRGCRIFRMYKFRSMIEGAHRTDIFIDGEQDRRITRVGRVLRKTALDELPQLFNVLKGDMSIIGPRPALPFHLDEYSPRQMRRLEVNPGITGWAQINGRNSLSWPERIDLDIWYIDNRSFFLDLRIILLTIPVLIRSEGVYAGREKYRFDNTVEKIESAEAIPVEPCIEQEPSAGKRRMVNQ